MSNNDESRKLKRVLIKEELVMLTGHYIKAIFLNQFLYWGDRTKDIDQYIREEIERDESADIELTHGWIYKKADELVEETMLDMSTSTARKWISELVESGWIDERKNPKYKWDKTYQYRPNWKKIDHDLCKLGYSLQGYKISNRISDSEVRSSESEDRGSESEDRIAENRTAIPETTTETTTEEGESPTIQDWFAQRETPTKQLEGGLTAEEYKNRIRDTLIRSAARNKTRKFDLDQYPEEVRPIIQVVCDYWHIYPPTSKSERGYWIEGARSLRDACGEYGIELIAGFFEDEYQLMRDKFAVNSPRSLVNSVRGYAAKMRMQDATDSKKGIVEYELDDGTTIGLIPDD